MIRTAATLLALTAALACGAAEDPPATRPAAADWRSEPDAYVGSSRCTACHAEEAARWSGSHHALAMQEPTEATVLGRFDGARFEGERMSASFHRDGADFVVRLAGPDGRVEDHRVAWLLGIDPLQQLVLPLPGGRLQALDVAWDTRPAEQGGQRWYGSGLEPPSPPGDVMHWSGLAWNANHMCLDCHTTGFEKGYRADQRRFETRFAEAGVGCEACHGQGARHVAWAEAGAPAGGPGLAQRFPAPVPFVLHEGEAIARSDAPPRRALEVEACGPCHARRLRIAEEPPRGRPLPDDHRVALLREGLYHADGQVQDEVYVYGSFIQSRMARAGVTCSDCHDAHGTELRREGNDVCAPCHRPAVFDHPSHHRHARGSAAARCVSCHMPESVFMGIDGRRDHSFRVPRPALAREIGAPDPCTTCHADRAPGFAAEAIEAWRGGAAAPTGQAHYGRVLHAGREGLPGAPEALRRLAGDAAEPAIARATALELLAARPDPASAAAFVRGLEDPDPLVRAAAVSGFETAPPPVRVRLLMPLLRDPLRTVRLEAARSLAPVASALGDEARLLEPALDELLRAEREHADRPEGQLRLAQLHVARGDALAAERALREALHLAPGFVPAAVNLADHLRRTGRDAEGEAVLREALSRAGDQAPLHHALGLLLVREERRDEALASLARAAELAPSSGRMVVAAALARYDRGDVDEALAELEDARARLPGDAVVRDTLARLYAAQGRMQPALEVARELVGLTPDDPSALRLLRELGGQADAPGP